MIKYLFNKTSIIIKYILFFFLFFIIIESISRGFIWTVTKDLKTFSYGFNKDIKIDIFHLKKLDIKLTDLYLINQASLKNKSKYKKKSTDVNSKIWVFGGSTTAGNNCGKNSSSWPTELSKLNNNIKIYNFGSGGIDSEKSLYKLRNAILNESIPKEIWWAHKFNEINVIYQGLKSNKDKVNYVFTDQSKKKLKFFFLKLDTTFKKNFLSYKILENIILGLSRKIIMNVDKEHINKNLNYKDFEYASYNYKINILEAIKLSKKNNINKFIIISLPAKLDYEKKMKDLFFVHYYERVKEIIKDEYVNFVDISNHPNFTKEEKNIFCDEVHKTYKGNLITAKMLSKYLIN